MMLNERYVLNNGVEIPKIGLGTWMIDADKSAPVASNAIKTGYRLFDLGYDNQSEIVKGIKESGIERKDVFISTKISANCKSYQETADAIENHLKELDLEYLDMLVIHAPQPWMDFKNENVNYDAQNVEVWKAMEEAYKAKKVRAIGVSNFAISDIQNLLDHCSVKPMVNQILAHVSNTPFELIDFCEKNDILVEAYSPFGHGELMKNEQLSALADQYKVSVSQLCTRYCLQMGMLPLPKTQTLKYLKSNADVDFVITDEDMAYLKSFEKIENYGDASIFPVYGGSLDASGSYNPGKPL